MKTFRIKEENITDFLLENITSLKDASPSERENCTFFKLIVPEKNENVVYLGGKKSLTFKKQNSLKASVGDVIVFQFKDYSVNGNKKINAEYAYIIRDFDDHSYILEFNGEKHEFQN